MKHIGTKELNTERLILRRFKNDDAQEMFNNWANDMDVCRYLTWYPHKDVEITKEILKAWIDSYKEDNFYNWGIVVKQSNSLIGNISVVESNDQLGSLTIGYCISKQEWRKGYTSESLKRVIQYLFEEVEADIIISRHSQENPNSGKVMEKAGMKFEGVLRRRDVCISGITDMAMYSLLKEEYKKE